MIKQYSVRNNIIDITRLYAALAVITDHADDYFAGENNCGIMVVTYPTNNDPILISFEGPGSVASLLPACETHLELLESITSIIEPSKYNALKHLIKIYRAIYDNSVTAMLIDDKIIAARLQDVRTIEFDNPFISVTSKYVSNIVNKFAHKFETIMKPINDDIAAFALELEILGSW